MYPVLLFLATAAVLGARSAEPPRQISRRFVAGISVLLAIALASRRVL